jgi:hypothetical protein
MFMVFNKKGQAAMEFLMTYGWAIMVVLIVIGALAYFGVLSPTNLLPEKCFLPLGMSCEDHQVTTNSVQLNIRNSMGDRITFVEKSGNWENTVTSDSDSAATCTAVTGDGKGFALISESGGTETVTGGKKLANGQTSELTFTCNGLSGFEDQKEKFTVTLWYRKGSSSIAHPLKGEILSTVIAS